MSKNEMNCNSCKTCKLVNKQKITITQAAIEQHLHQIWHYFIVDGVSCAEINDLILKSIVHKQDI